MATQLAEPVAEPIDTGQDTEQLEAQSVPDRDYEGEARSQGWTDKDSFKGDPSRWVDAETFVKRADEVMPLLRKQLSHYRAELDQVKREIKKVRKSEQAAYENALTDLKAQMEQAVVTGDVAKFKALDEKADSLRKDIADDTPAPDRQAEAMKAFADWRDQNEWYDLGNLAGAEPDERRKRAYADRMMDANIELTKTMDPADFFEHITGLVEAKYPDQKALRPKPAESVAGVTRTAAGKSGKTGANLPAEAKDAVRRYMRQNIYPGKTFEEACNIFAKDYDWSIA